MFSVLKACFLFELIYLSSCEISRIKRASSSIIDPISKLLPSLNITVVFGGPEPVCCKTGNPLATCEPCKVCPPVGTCESCSDCPPENTCETCSTCPPPVTCGDSETCPPDNDHESSCLGTGSFYCPKGKICITTIFGPRTYDEALQKCSSLSQNLPFELGDDSDFTPPTDACMLNAIPALAVMNNMPIWAEPRSGDMCSTISFQTDEDRIIGDNGLSTVSCDEKHPFYCIYKF